MFRTTTLVLLAAVAAGCSDSSTGPDGMAGNIAVDPAGGADFATLGEAVRAAVPGAVIQLAAGSYDERITVSKAITIRGAGSGSILLASGPSGQVADDSAVLVIRGVSGVVVENVRFSGGVDSGILVRDAVDVTLKGVEASGNLDHGLTVRASQRVTVSGGSFDDNGDSGIRVRDGSSEVSVVGVSALRNGDDGVLIRDSATVSVSGGEIAGSVESGIRVEGSSSTVISGVEIHGNGEWGVRATVGSLSNEGTVLQDNDVHGNVQGDLRLD
jgi:hypothetical protein